MQLNSSSLCSKYHYLSIDNQKWRMLVWLNYMQAVKGTCVGLIICGFIRLSLCYCFPEDFRYSPLSCLQSVLLILRPLSSPLLSITWLPSFPRLPNHFHLIFTPHLFVLTDPFLLRKDHQQTFSETTLFVDLSLTNTQGVSLKLWTNECIVKWKLASYKWYENLS